MSANLIMYFTKVTKHYKDGEVQENKYGNEIPEKAQKRYLQEVKNAKKIVDYIPVTSVIVELLKNDKVMESIIVEPAGRLVSLL